MNNDTGLLAESYLNWMRKHVIAEALEDDVTELTTPFMDRHNDHLQIYAERLGADLFLLTDDGYIFSELKSSGVEGRGRRREKMFNEILAGYGIQREGNELHVEATSRNLGQRVHNLLQAMLSLDDMFVLAQSRVLGVFYNDVARFLDEFDVRYSPRVKFAGKSGLDHLVDFVIPKSRNAPERILQVVNSPRRDRIQSLLFAAEDTKAARGKDVSYYALINDLQRDSSPDVMRALSTYEIEARPWSRREEIAERLAA